ncbi:MAG TPA: ATP-grasp domain-containing protein [Gammaproteobacteria bacterium]|nr:ATP-grasp domain-containing protein [Gammaproteobacteria bacterium]
MLRNTDPILIVALSGRALARSAHAAMIPVTVLDVFCDVDTQVWANSVNRVGSLSGGIEFRRLPEMADRLCPPRRCAGVVYGAGFEACPQVLSVLSERRELFGNEAQVLADICTPKKFFSTLAQLGVPFPEVRFRRPSSPHGWLAKRAGASGGMHVQEARRTSGQHGCYYQRRVPGRVMSLLFLANGRAADVVGVSELWNAGIASAPYGYGGAVSHQRVSASLYKDFRQLVYTLTRQWNLRGLNGVDLVVDGNDFKVLEVNARPTATAELYDYESRRSLFRQHLDACRGAALSRRYRVERMYAHRVIYAQRDFSIPHEFSWPNWCSDRPAAGTDIRRGEPVCTVHASGNSPFGLNGFLKRRARFIRETFEPACTSPDTVSVYRSGVCS